MGHRVTFIRQKWCIYILKSIVNLQHFRFPNSLKNLWFLLDKHQIPPMIGEEAMINYENFVKVGEKAGPKCK